MPVKIKGLPIKVTLPDPESRIERLLHVQIALTEETNGLRRQIRDRLPAFRIVPIEEAA